MPVLDVVNAKKEKVGEVTVSDRIFVSEGTPGLLHQVVTAQRAGARAGTSKVKGRAEVSGGGRKPWRQKGTGQARAGTNRSPLWRGGGITFGPHPRDYSQSTPKKVKRAALYQALGAKLKDEAVLVVEELTFEKPSTKEFLKAMAGLNLETTQKLLIVADKKDDNLIKSARNLQKVKVIPLEGLNVYAILNADKLVFTQDSAKKMEEVWGL